MEMDHFMDEYMRSCTLCPRSCKVDRLSGARGVCGVPADVYVARAALHFWEEPCISGANGSGAVFFTGCGLKCAYCQNAPISGTGAKTAREPDGGPDDLHLPGILGRRVTVEHLSEIFLRLQNGEGANNINLVTAAQYIPQVAAALKLAKESGLTIPVVYNSSGYEKVESLRLLDGLVDVYLPDFKYMDKELARKYSHAADYPEAAKAAIGEMVRQAGSLEFYDEPAQPKKAGSKYPPGGRLIRKGVIVRHMLLPGHVKNARAVVKYLHETYGSDIYISMMNQYTPMGTSAGDDKDMELLARKVTKREYERLVDYAVEIGVGNGFVQEGGTAKESFIPSWNGEGV